MKMVRIHAASDAQEPWHLEDQCDKLGTDPMRLKIMNYVEPPSL